MHTIGSFGSSAESRQLSSGCTGALHYYDFEISDTLSQSLVFGLVVSANCVDDYLPAHDLRLLLSFTVAAALVPVMGTHCVPVDIASLFWGHQCEIERCTTYPLQQSMHLY